MIQGRVSLSRLRDGRCDVNDIFTTAVFDLKTRVAKNRVRAASRAMRRAEAEDPERARILQRDQAMRLARYAFDETPFYRDRYHDAGFNRRDLYDPDSFGELPIIRKAELRERGADFLAPKVPSRLRLNSATGGSTGEPLALLHDSRAPVAAMWWRVYRWWGVAPSDHKAFIQRERRTPAAQLRNTIEWWPTRHIALDSRNMSPSSMHAFYELWQEVGPRLLNGYVGGVHEFASFVDRNGLSIRAPRAIGVTAAPTTPSQRAYIGSVLGAPVYDQYRSAEIPWIAAQCAERSALHVLSDLRLVEIVGEDRRVLPPGMNGGIVVTDLCNRVFPLIRYDMGDVAHSLDTPCPCGMSLTRISEVGGRVTDVVRLPNGQSVAGGLTALFNSRPDAVRVFQIHQRADYSVALRYVAGDVADADQIAEAAAHQLADVLNNAVPVVLESVDHIPHDRGKARPVISDVPAGVLS